MVNEFYDSSEKTYNLNLPYITIINSNYERMRNITRILSEDIKTPCLRYKKAL